MAEIIVFERVFQKLDRLEDALYDEGYFGFLESAENYVNEVVNCIYKIENLKHYRTVNPFFGIGT